MIINKLTFTILIFPWVPVCFFTAILWNSHLALLLSVKLGEVSVWVPSLRTHHGKVFAINKAGKWADGHICEHFAKKRRRRCWENTDLPSFLLASGYVWSNQKEMKFQVGSFPFKMLCALVLNVNSIIFFPFFFSYKREISINRSP